jgi:hypothetical protein
VEIILTVNFIAKISCKFNPIKANTTDSTSKAHGVVGVANSTYNFVHYHLMTSVTFVKC